MTYAEAFSLYVILRKKLFTGEIFVEYMRILDRYHTRIYGNEETNKIIKTALKAVTKDIREKIFDKDGNPTFVNAIKGVILDWRYNAKNVEDVARLIAAGYTQIKDYVLEHIKNII